MSISLRDLVANYKVLENLEDMEPEVREDTLASLQDAIEVKAENIAYVIRSKDLEVDVIKAEIKRLQDRCKSVENAKERLKTYLEEQLTLANVDKVKTPYVTVALQNNTPSVQIADENLVPAEFITIETIRKIDKKSLLQRLKDGETFDGISIHQGRSLRIR
jgi:seryl-tRNA synthetase